MFDKSDRQSFERIDFWIEQISTHGAPNVKAIIVGNKSDLENVVSDEEAQEKAERWGTQYISTCARNFDDANLIFETITRKVYDGGAGILKSEAVSVEPRLGVLYRENECC